MAVQKTVFKLIAETNKNESLVCFSFFLRLYFYLSFNQFWGSTVTQNSVPEEKWKDNRCDVHINKPQLPNQVRAAKSDQIENGMMR